MKNILQFVLNARNKYQSRRKPSDITNHAIRLSKKGNYAEAWDVLNEGLLLFPRNAEIIAVLPQIPCHYDEVFYGKQAEGSLRSAVKYVDAIKKVMPFQSAVDFGAGIGTWLEAAKMHGASELLGVEGEWVKDNPRRYDAASYLYADLNSSVSINRRFDLAISVEVAEHLQPDRGESFVDDITRCSNLVVFGAAMPRQSGNAHINGRPHSYWAQIFRDRDYECIDFFRPKFWNDPSVEPWYVQNTYLYVKREEKGPSSWGAAATLLDVYHPSLVNSWVKQDAKNGITDPRGPLI